jgi:hypothetical protein
VLACSASFGPQKYLQCIMFHSEDESLDASSVFVSFCFDTDLHLGISLCFTTLVLVQNSVQSKMFRDPVNALLKCRPNSNMSIHRRFFS